MPWHWGGLKTISTQNIWLGTFAYWHIFCKLSNSILSPDICPLCICNFFVYPPYILHLNCVFRWLGRLNFSLGTCLCSNFVFESFKRQPKNFSPLFWDNRRRRGAYSNVHSPAAPLGKSAFNLLLNFKMESTPKYLITVPILWTFSGQNTLRTLIFFVVNSILKEISRAVLL